MKRSTLVGANIAVALALALTAPMLSSLAQAAPPASSTSDVIYTCTTADGRGLTQDRVIDECWNREQRVTRRDGTLIRVVPPQLFGAEKAAYEARRAKEKAELDARADDEVRDRALMRRYSNADVHQKARENALKHIVTANKNSKEKLAALDIERKPLKQEAEFYKGKSLPQKLQEQFDQLETSESVIRSAMKVQGEEMARINGNYDVELARLKKLWAGAKPGSMGPLPQPKL